MYSFFPSFSHCSQILSNFCFSFLLFLHLSSNVPVGNAHCFLFPRWIDSLLAVNVVLSKNENITDFFVEAAIDGGTHKGIFRSETQSSWHRKHKQHHSNYFNDHFQNIRKTFSNQFTGTSVIGTTRNESTKLAQANNRIRVDESGISVANNNDEQASAAFDSSSSSNSNYVPNLSNSMRKTKRFKATNNHATDHCAQEYWSESIVSGSRIIQFTKRWSYTKTDLKNKTVSFRFVLIPFRRWNLVNVAHFSPIFLFSFLVDNFSCVEFYLEKSLVLMYSN